MVYAFFRVRLVDMVGRLDTTVPPKKIIPSSMSSNKHFIFKFPSCFQNLLYIKRFFFSPSQDSTLSHTLYLVVTSLWYILDLEQPPCPPPCVFKKLFVFHYVGSFEESRQVVF